MVSVRLIDLACPIGMSLCSLAHETMVDAYNRTVHLISVVIRDAPSRPGTVITIGAVTWLVYWYLHRRRALPGPPRLPLLGNLLQVPLRSQFIPYTDWSRKYGVYARFWHHS